MKTLFLFTLMCMGSSFAGAASGTPGIPVDPCATMRCANHFKCVVFSATEGKCVPKDFQSVTCHKNSHEDMQCKVACNHANFDIGCQQ